MNNKLLFLCIYIGATSACMLMLIVYALAPVDTVQHVTNVYNTTEVVYENHSKNYYDYSNNYTTIEDNGLDFPLRHRRECTGLVSERYVTGSSMQPFLVDGDEYHVMLMKWDDVTVHDVVLLDVNKSMPTIHALTYKNEVYGYSAGYDAEYNDEWVVTPNMVLGVYCEW